jgi:hypothetical protein
MYVLSIVVRPFVLFLMAIVLSVLLRHTVSDCPFGIFKLFIVTYSIIYLLKICLFFSYVINLICNKSYPLSILTVADDGSKQRYINNENLSDRKM